MVEAGTLDKWKRMNISYPANDSLWQKYNRRGSKIYKILLNGKVDNKNILLMELSMPQAIDITKYDTISLTNKKSHWLR